MRTRVRRLLLAGFLALAVMVPFAGSVAATGRSCSSDRFCATVTGTGMYVQTVSVTFTVPSGSCGVQMITAQGYWKVTLADDSLRQTLVQWGPPYNVLYYPGSYGPYTIGIYRNMPNANNNNNTYLVFTWVSTNGQWGPGGCYVPGGKGGEIWMWIHP